MRRFSIIARIVNEGLHPEYIHALESAKRDLSVLGGAGSAKLSEHIAQAHLALYVLPWYGVARFDIDLAEKMNAPLDGVIEYGVQRLKTGWRNNWERESEPGYQFFAVYRRLGLPWNEDWCKLMVVKNMLYVEQKKLAVVDWAEVRAIYPAAAGVSLDIKRDSFDPEFPEIDIPLHA